MAAEVRGFQVLACLLLLFGPYSYANLPSKCKISVGKSTYFITNWTWKVVASKNPYSAYYINVCGEANHCPSGSAVCSTSSHDDKSPQNVGSVGQQTLNATSDAGFYANYTGGQCNMGNDKTWGANIFMRCGKFLGSPQFVDVFVGNSMCVVVFEFVTNEACKTHPEPEIPCSLYGNDDELRDLTPLIKLQGGHEVSSSVPNFDFYINVCRGITPKQTDATKHCPTNSSMCRFDKNLQKAEDVGSISYTSGLTLKDKNDIVLVYNTTKKVSGCLTNPVTTVTFRCPGRNMGDKGPLLTAAHDCAFEILWETDFACPKSSVMATSSCVLNNEFVNFNLTKLTTAKLSNYKVYQNVTEKDGSITHYIYYINVCQRLGIPCEGSESTICQEVKDGSRRKSLGVISKQKLRYADGQLTLTYEHGSKCSSGLNRTTIIMFICDYHAGIGHPVFNSEIYCFYYFDWRTKYACPPTRRTGTQCRVESPSGLRYDLSELVRMENAPNWIAVDGESSDSNNEILINVCGQLTTHPEVKQCDSSAAICMIDKSKGKVVSLGRYTDPPTLNPDKSIKLLYTQGSECKKDNTGKSVAIKSTITFVCQLGDLTNPPVLVTRTLDNCHYEFMWKTAAACSLGLNVGQDCRVEDKDAGYVFDLTPLAQKTWNNKDFYTVENGESQYRYQLKVCGGSNQIGCVGSNVSSCQIKKADPKSNWTLGLKNDKLYYYDGMLNLTYTGGKKCHNGVSRKTHITFLCNRSAVDDGIGEPEFEKENHCIYNFRWFTKYACPEKVTECVARSNTHQYDLTSLVRTKDNWEVPDKKNGTFYINVCRSLNLVSGCSGTAAVCWKHDGKAINLGTVSNPPSVEGNNVVITYTDGDKCGDKHYKTKINFLCKKGQQSKSPTFDEAVDNGCTYVFHWETAAACAIQNVMGDNCAVKDPKSDTTFNLIPLKKKSNGAMYSGNMTDSKKQAKFELNICDSLPESACGKEKDISACLIKSDGKTTTTIALGKKSTKLEYKGEIVTLVYREGDNFEETGQQREVHIKFYCNSNKPFGEPSFTGQEGNKYFFDFQTSLVCSASAVQCLVTGRDNVAYDLSPLGLTYGNWEAVDTRTQNKHLHYFINVCRAVNPTGEVLKCPGGAIGACQIDHSQDKGFNLGYVQSNPQITGKGELTLQYSGGTVCRKQFSRSVRIVFSCSERMGSPVFLAESPECEYLFSWETPSACPLKPVYGHDCTVEDKQYGYMFNMSLLYNKLKDYNVSVSGGDHGERIILNVCNKLVGSPKACSGNNVGACIIGGKNIPIDTTQNLTYYNGQIQITYGKSPAIKFTFECNQEITARDTGLTCEKKNEKLYECNWQTPIACRPMINVQCSIRDENGNADTQYDYLSLSKNDRNWQARVLGPNIEDAAYFINVCRTVILKGVAKYCSPTAGVCMVKGGKSYNLGTIRHGPRKRGTSMYLDYVDGDTCPNGKNYSTHILMACGVNEGEPTYVTFKPVTCEYEFLWTTSAACSVNDKKENTFDNCTAVNPLTKVLFDLNELRGGDDYVVADKKGNSYRLNVCGPLVHPPKGCNTKSGVCQIGQQTYNAGISNSQLHFVDGILYLNLSGGDACHHVKKNRETIVQFVCSPSHGSKDIGKPVFISEDDCTYFVIWHTSLVCERQYECAALQKGNDGTVKYSLGRLMRTDANWVVTSEVGTKDSSTYVYYVNLCRPLLPMPGTNCPAGAWACRVRKSINGKQVQSLGSAVDPPVVEKNGEVHLVYKGPTKCEKDTTKYLELHFKFSCAYGSLGHPVLESEDDCVSHVTWATAAACPDTQKADLEHCRVFDNGTRQYYTLMPLSVSHDSNYYTVGKQSDRTYFLLSVCRPLSLSGDHCKGAGVCLVSKDGDKESVYKSLGLYEYRTMTYYKDEEMLILKYCSEDCSSSNPKSIKSQITFICDRSQTSNGQPQKQSYGSNGADFVFRTSLVCPPLERECSYTDGKSIYNLQLLTSQTRSWYYEHNKDRFWINICRGISDGPAGCPSSASVCMIRGGSKTVNILGLTSTQMMKISDGNLQLTYSGLPPVEGCNKGSNSIVVFYFECGKHVGQPQFEREEWSSCSFIIKWKSSVACKVEREKIAENNCVVKHPLTGRNIDFKKLVHDGSESTWKIIGNNEKGDEVSYYINVCGTLDKEAPCGEDKASVCWNKKTFVVKSRRFYFEGSMFSLEMRSSEEDSTPVFVINFQCSEGEGVGSPKFDYLSSNKHHFFTWPTSIVCSQDLSHEVTDIPEAGHKAVKSASKKNTGIALGVIFAILLVVIFVVVFYKPSRRHHIISCVRLNFKKHVLRKEIKYPTYRYQKLDVSDDDEADSLIKIAEGSDEEENEDDDDLLPF